MRVFRIRAIRAFQITTLLTCFLLVATATAGPREQAKRMHDRLAGVPPTTTVLDEMTAKIEQGDLLGAALQAMENPAFYNTTIKDFAAPWVNREQSVYEDLNDFTATIIGMVRDEVPFNRVLSDDIIYTGAAGIVADEYSHTDNRHYERLQAGRIDLSDTNNLVQRRQSDLPDTMLTPQTAAGVMTTRAFAKSYLVAGTNRAALRFASLNFLCKDMEDLRDITSRPDRIRQDVTRSPGGDSKIFLNDCLSCHAGMDGLAGGFAYYDFDEELERLVYTANMVQPKYLRDAGAFRFGYATTDDSWINYWNVGSNSYLIWNGSGFGNGAKSLGVELASTRQFSVCQVEKAFEKVCHRQPSGQSDVDTVNQIANVFENSNYSMKRVFAETAVACMGD